ncbi:MAG: hypothetical protein ACR2RB_12725 [Gammaproteobacteria bacterium]
MSEPAEKAPPESSAQESFPALIEPAPVRLNLDKLRIGTNNYHVDVHLSPRFLSLSREVIRLSLKQLISRSTDKNAKEELADALQAFTKCYIDLSTGAVHRNKQHKRLEEVELLQLAVIKVLVQSVDCEIDDIIADLKETARKQRGEGSSLALVTHEKVVNLGARREYVSFYTKLKLARELRKAESYSLSKLRERLLGVTWPIHPGMLFNPVLLARSPDSQELMMEFYVLLGIRENDNDSFTFIGELLGQVFAEQLPQRLAASYLPAESDHDDADLQPDLYDELGGLLHVGRLLGHSKGYAELAEQPTWFDVSSNIDKLFKAPEHEEEIESHTGWLSRLRGRSNDIEYSPPYERFLAIKQCFIDAGILDKICAAYELAELWDGRFSVSLNPIMARDYVYGGALQAVAQRKLTADAQNNNTTLTEALNEATAKFRRLSRIEQDNRLLRCLKDLSRYRRDLQLLRLSHRALNRIKILTEDDELRLSQVNNCLYEFVASEEIERGDSGIKNHAIVKADVRGSMAVTQELYEQELNPATHFSSSFFQPISALLAVYSAEKVFIEGDAVILSVFEQLDRPRDWFAVSRACGLAFDMLNVVHTKNFNNKKKGLPPLELGIGIDFAEGTPTFLYDEDRPIMISPAIGNSDRLSSCSSILRKQIEDTGARRLFNVDVVSMEEGETDQKGQTQLRYNVNGVLLSSAAFKKLETEIVLTSYSLRLHGESEPVTLHRGSYPDAQGKMRMLLIRAGKIGIWRDNRREALPVRDELFYELVTNTTLLAQLKKRIESENAA